MFPANSNLKVLGISGSLRERSSSQIALEYALRLLREADCETSVFDLRSANLPFCNGNPDEQAKTSTAVAALRKAVAETHALVLVTPEYHGAISGVLKNTLDLLDSKQLNGKVVGVVSVLGGAPNNNAWNDLSRILRCCHAWAIPQHIAVSRASSVFVNGQVTDIDLRLRFHEFAEHLAQSASRLWGLERVAISA